MLRLLSPNIKLVAKNGECSLHLTIDLNINVNTATVEVTKITQKEDKSEELLVDKSNEPIDWALPDLGKSEKVQFGKEGEK